MKKSKIALTALAFAVAIGGAFISKAQATSTVHQSSTYYQPGACTSITCTSALNFSCAGFYPVLTDCQANNGNNVLPSGTNLKHS